MKRLAVGILASLAILFATVAAARAEERSCVGDLGNVLVNGNLVVPNGASCALHDLLVTGDVVVGRAARLRVYDGVTIRGNLRVDRCDFVSFEPSGATDAIAVGGNVEIAHCSETSGKLFTPGRVTIIGNFACHDNPAPCFGVSLTIGGDAQVSHNQGGISYVEGNTIGGNLLCDGNTGIADYGSPNIVAGKKLGQCAGLSD